MKRRTAPAQSALKPERVEQGRANQKRGHSGEAVAAAYLVSKGAQIVALNWRPRGLGTRGEVDLIVRVGEFTCFVEVKTRSSLEYGEPQELVDSAKQRQLGRLANAYLTQHNQLETPARFDVVEVWLLEGHKPRVEWIPGAFEVRI